jgi:membrane protein
MNQRLDRALTVGRAIVHEVRTEKITFLAGSIAYHAFVSLLPLLLLVLAVIAAVGDASLQQGFISLTEAVLTPEAGEVLVGELRDAGTSVSVFGLVVLVWGTLRIFRGLDTAFSDIYESEARNTFADQLADGIVVLGAFAAALIAGAAVESLVDFEAVGTVGWVLHRLLLVVALSVVLFPIYFIFPDEDVSVVEVVPGVLFASAGLTVFESVFRYYVEYSGRTGDGSVVAGILVLLTWLYVSGLVILLGAVVNAVLSNRSEDVNVRPVLGGVEYDPDRDRVDRGSVVGALERLDRLLETADEVVVSADGEEVRLPRPDGVTTETGGDLLPGSLSLEFRWSAGVLEDGEVDAAGSPTGGSDD